MKVTITNRNVLQLAAPISLALLIPLLNNLTNNYFLGQVGVRELAVNGVSGVFYLALTMIGYGLANGTQVLLSRRVAQGDTIGIARLFINGVMLAVFLSLCLMMISLWMAPLIFGLSLHSNDHVMLSVNYLYIRVWGLPFLMLTQLANSFYIASGRSRYLMAGSVAATFVNILLDYLLIFGHYGFPKMGLQGAAAASVIAELAGCGALWLLFYLRGLHLQYPLPEYLQLDLKLCQRLLRISAPLIVQYFFSIGGWLVFFIFVEHLGERELAASQILRSIFSFVAISTWAFAATTNTMVSNLIGQGRQREVVLLVHKVAKISLVVTSGFCALLLLGGRFYLSLFTNDAGLIELALPSLRVIALATVIMSVSTAVFNGVVGTGRTMVNLTMEVTCVGTYVLYCYLVIEKLRAPLYIAWMAEFVYWTSLAVISYLYLRSGRWRGKVL